MTSLNRQVIQSLRINRKESDGRAVFWSHIADGGAVRQAEARDAGPVKFDKLGVVGKFAVFWSHIADGGAVRQAEARDAGPVKFDKLADNAFCPKHLSNR